MNINELDFTLKRQREQTSASALLEIEKKKDSPPPDLPFDLPKQSESEKNTEETKNLFSNIQKHLDEISFLTIQTERTLVQLVATLVLIAKPKTLDVLLLKNTYQKLLKEVPLVEKKSKEVEKKSRTIIVLPSQKMFEYCLLSLLSSSKGYKKKTTTFRFLIVLYLVFDFGLKLEHLSFVKRKDLLQIEENKFILNERKLIVTKRAKQNFSLIQQYINREFFTEELLFSDIKASSISRSFNKELKALAAIWNQVWTLQDFRFSFVRNILVYEEPDHLDFCHHYDVTMPRIYQLRTQKNYSIENLIVKSSIFPYLEFIDSSDTQD